MTALIRTPPAPTVLALLLAGAGCGAAPIAGPTAGPTMVSAPAEEACAPASFDALARQLRDHYCDTAEGSIAASELESCDDIEVTQRCPRALAEGSMRGSFGSPRRAGACPC